MFTIPKLVSPAPIRTPRHLIDPRAFALAMISAPVLIGILFAPAFGISLFALAFGGPVFLLLGTPVLIWDLQHNAPSVQSWSAQAFIGNLILFLGFTLFSGLTGDRDLESLAAMTAFGLIFAPVWGGTAALLYRSLRRPFYAQPL